MSQNLERYLTKGYQKRDIDIYTSPIMYNALDDCDGLMASGAAFMKQKKAARYVGVSVPTLRKYFRLGFITRYRHGSRYFYRIDELEELRDNIF